MLTHNCIDNAVPHTGHQRLTVGFSAQGRPDMKTTVEAGQGRLGEDQLVHGNIGGNLHAAIPGLGQHLDAAGTGQLAQVQAHPGLFRQQ